MSKGLSCVIGVPVLFSAACTPSSPDEPMPSASVLVLTTSPSATVAPSETALSEEELLELIPAEARTEDFPGAAAFAAFFVTEYYRMFAEQDPQLFEFMSGEECGYCKSVLNEYSIFSATGLSRSGGEITVHPALATGSLMDDGTRLVEIPVEVAASMDIGSDSAVASEDPGGRGVSAFQLSWTSGRWIVLGVASDVTTRVAKSPG